MKKILLLLCFFFIGNTTKAQDVTGIVLGTDFTYQVISSTQHQFTFHTYFNMGSAGTCPPFTEATFTIVGNVLYVKAYYDIRGAWPQVGCNRVDTAVYTNALPSNITHIIASTNVIQYGSGPSGIAVVENVYIRDWDLSVLATSTFNTKTISVYPNPTKGTITISNEVDFDTIAITNSLGQMIATITKNQSGVYNLQDLQNGLYYITFYNATTEKMGVVKLIKQN
jgi:hypothetical protein